MMEQDDRQGNNSHYYEYEKAEVLSRFSVALVIVGVFLILTAFAVMVLLFTLHDATPPNARQLPIVKPVSVPVKSPPEKAGGLAVSEDDLEIYQLLENAKTSKTVAKTPPVKKPPAKVALATVPPANVPPANVPPAAPMNVPPAGAKTSPPSFTVQIAAARNSQALRQHYSAVKKKHAALFVNLPHIIKTANTPRGLYHRLLISGFENRQAAVNFCVQLKKHKQDCFVRP